MRFLYIVDGYNNGMMAREKWMDKQVDDLRVANKQKASGIGLLGYEGPFFLTYPEKKSSLLLLCLTDNKGHYY